MAQTRRHPRPDPETNHPSPLIGTLHGVSGNVEISYVTIPDHMEDLFFVGDLQRTQVVREAPLQSI